MGATAHDIFGNDGSAVAEPGSYGEPPRGYRLPVATRLGGVRLQVADLARSRAFYERVLGLRVLAFDTGRVTLGVPGQLARAADAPRVEVPLVEVPLVEVPLVELIERPGARPMAPRGRLGLYHVAFLLPDRASLGRFVRHLTEQGVRAGAGDHLVSEAFYLTDPDGLGIEVYADRPRSRWRRVGRELMMATDPVDVPDLLRVAHELPWVGMPAGTVVGHVHLHVGSVDDASAFFSDALGFDRTVWHYPGALFLAAGGYHHHLGTNTWAGSGARPPVADDARLMEWTVEVPSAHDVDAVGASLAASGYPAERTPAGELVTSDPWGTGLRVRVSRPL